MDKDIQQQYLETIEKLNLNSLIITPFETSIDSRIADIIEAWQQSITLKKTISAFESACFHYNPTYLTESQIKKYFKNMKKNKFSESDLCYNRVIFDSKKSRELRKFLHPEIRDPKIMLTEEKVRRVSCQTDGHDNK